MGCVCDHAGHCFRHHAITNSTQRKECVDGTPPTPAGRVPCIYLGQYVRDRRDSAIYMCSIHGQCTLAPNRLRKAACSDCKDYLTTDDPDIATKFLDPLEVTDSKKNISHMMRNTLNGHSAFLVCGGPSLKQVDYNRLRERGVFSLGVNNVAAQVPVDAFLCSDPPNKFHAGIFLDAKMIKFLPTPKLDRKRGTIRIKESAKKFKRLEPKTNECPRAFGFQRRSWMLLDDSWFVHRQAPWGNQKDGINKGCVPPEERCAMTMLLGLRMLQYLGARKIFLLGVDFYMDPRRGLAENYSFGELRDGDAITSNNRHFQITNRWLTELRPIFEKFGFHTYNCFANSGLRAFDYVPFDEAVDYCRGEIVADLDGEVDLVGYYNKKDFQPEGSSEE